MVSLTPSALAKNASTSAFKVNRFGRFTVYFRGSLDNETLTMQVSFDSGITWKSFYCATVAQTYTNASDIVNAQDYELEGAIGLQFRYTMSNGAGTPSGVLVEVGGTNVSKA
jgi:hypothetical protein